MEINTNKIKPLRDKYEYKYISIWNKLPSQIVSELNRYGEDGWRAACEIDTRVYERAIILMRKKELN